MTRDVISRSLARQMGLDRYFTGKPCKHGHVAERYLFGGCVDCMKMHKSKDEYKQGAREYSRRYRRENPDAIKEANAAAYWSDPDHHRARRNKARAENRAEERRKAKERKAAQRDYYTHLQSKRRAAKLQRTLGGAANDNDKIRHFYTEARRMTEATGIPHHVDHIVPLQGANVCGLHVWWNLQVIPANENLSKGNRFSQQEFGIAAE